MRGNYFYDVCLKIWFLHIFSCTKYIQSKMRKKVFFSTKQANDCVVSSFFNPLIIYGQIFGILTLPNDKIGEQNGFKLILLTLHRALNVTITSLAIVLYIHSMIVSDQKFGMDSKTFIKLHIFNFMLCSQFLNFSYFGIYRRMTNFIDTLINYHPYKSLVFKSKKNKFLNKSLSVLAVSSSLCGPCFFGLIFYGYIRFPVIFTNFYYLNYIFMLSFFYYCSSFTFFYFLYKISLTVVSDGLKCYNKQFTIFSSQSIAGKIQCETFSKSLLEFHKNFQHLVFVMESCNNLLSLLAGVIFAFSMYIICVILFLVTKVYREDFFETFTPLLIWTIVIQISFTLTIVFALIPYLEVQYNRTLC